MSKRPYYNRRVNRYEDWERLGLLENATARPWEALPEPQHQTVDFSEWQRSEPIRQPKWESDVLVPLGQSLASGLFISLAAVPLNLYWLHGPFWTPLVIGGAAAGLSWLVLLSDHRHLLRRFERVVNRDLDGDGYTGEPQTVQHEYTVKEERSDGSQSWQIMVTLGIEPERLRKFAQAVLGGESTGTNRWTTGNGKLFERGEYERLRDDLIARGFAKYATGKNHGWSLTAKGRAWFRALAAEIG